MYSKVCQLQPTLFGFNQNFPAAIRLLVFKPVYLCGFCLLQAVKFVPHEILHAYVALLLSNGMQHRSKPTHCNLLINRFALC